MANTPCPAPPAATRLACTSAFLVADFILISLQQLAVSQRTHETSTQSQHAPSSKTHNNKAERMLTES